MDWNPSSKAGFLAKKLVKKLILNMNIIKVIKPTMIVSLTRSINKVPKSLVNEDLIVFRDHAATPYLADTGQYQIHRVITQHGVNHVTHLETLAQGTDQQSPP